jgi:nucleolar pre-ribosomal-associated protein 1
MITSAYQAVDWLRFVDRPLSSAELSLLVITIERFHKPALRDLYESLHPAKGLLGNGSDIASRFSQLRNMYESFISLYLCTANILTG